jgi:hypothetical protein
LISVTNEQLYILVGIPMLFNATLIGLVMAYINAKIGKVESRFDARFDAVDARFDAVDARFDAVDARFESVNVRFDSVNVRFDAVNRRFDGIDRRFDDMRDLWRAELRRVEEVLDARLKHIEDRG